MSASQRSPAVSTASASASDSTSCRVWVMSRRSVEFKEVTRKPFCPSRRTSPPPDKRARASRIGLAPIPYRAVSARTRSFSSGASAPRRISCFSLCVAASAPVSDGFAGPEFRESCATLRSKILSSVADFLKFAILNHTFALKARSATPEIKPLDRWIVAQLGRHPTHRGSAEVKHNRLISDPACDCNMLLSNNNRYTEAFQGSKRPKELIDNTGVRPGAVSRQRQFACHKGPLVPEAPSRCGTSIHSRFKRS